MIDNILSRISLKNLEHTLKVSIFSSSSPLISFSPNVWENEFAAVAACEPSLCYIYPQSLKRE